MAGVFRELLPPSMAPEPGCRLLSAPDAPLLGRPMGDAPRNSPQIGAISTLNNISGCVIWSEERPALFAWIQWHACFPV